MAPNRNHLSTIQEFVGHELSISDWLTVDQARINQFADCTGDHHIQSILNPPGNPKATFFTNPAHPADPEQWLASAQKRSGSWWEHWRDWLHARSGEQRPRRSRSAMRGMCRGGRRRGPMCLRGIKS